jgi:hypothetical protein
MVSRFISLKVVQPHGHRSKIAKYTRSIFSDLCCIPLYKLRKSLETSFRW